MAFALLASKASIQGSWISSRTLCSPTSTVPVVVWPSRLARKSRWSPAQSSVKTTNFSPTVERTSPNPFFKRRTASSLLSLWGMVTTTGSAISLVSFWHQRLKLTCGGAKPLLPGVGRLRLRGLRIAMAKPALRRHLVPDELLQLFDVGEAPMLLARPKKLAVESDFEHAAGVVRDKRHRAELFGKSGQELLRHP